MLTKCERAYAASFPLIRFGANLEDLGPWLVTLVPEHLVNIVNSFENYCG